MQADCVARKRGAETTGPLAVRCCTHATAADLDGLCTMLPNVKTALEDRLVAPLAGSARAEITASTSLEMAAIGSAFDS